MHALNPTHAGRRVDESVEQSRFTDADSGALSETQQMLRITVLGSGSRGNAILVDGTEGTLLIDAGFSARALMKRMAAVGRRPDQVSALLLTHEHTDHASGAVAACARWAWPLHATIGTLDAMRQMPAGCPANAASLSTTTTARLHGFDVQAVPVPHDARECAALVLTDRQSGMRVGIAMDLGHVPTALPEAFERLDLLVVESNHDERLLADGPYPCLSSSALADSSATCRMAQPPHSPRRVRIARCAASFSRT